MSAFALMGGTMTGRRKPRLKRPAWRRPPRKDWPPAELLLPSLAELRRLSEGSREDEPLELFETKETKS